MHLPFLVRPFRRPAKVRRVVYTCLFGYSEHFTDHHYEADDIDFICFTDNPDLVSSWTMRLVPLGLLDPARRSKQFKALPHRFLPDYDLSLYIDNTVRLKCRPADLFDNYLDPAQSAFRAFAHENRGCVYDEAEAVIELEYDDPGVVRQQMAFYRSLGFPAHHGLLTSCFLLRRHNDPALHRVMEHWHEQVLRYSKRDQLSLTPVMWSDNFTHAVMPEKFSEFRLFDWPVFTNNVRVPRDFDDARYREINPDVTGNCRKHYLEFGAAEGRAYK